MVRSLAANHALADGNKRLALTAMHATLLVNGYVYKWSQEEAEELILRIATGESDFLWLAEYIEQNSEYIGRELHTLDNEVVKHELLARRNPPG